MARKIQTSREARRVVHQQRRQRQRWLVIGLVIAGLIVLVGLGYVIRQSRYLGDVADVKLPESLDPPPGADGKAWGPPDAPVIFEDFSDFQ